MENTTISIYREENSFQIKLQSQVWELNIWLSEEDFYSLKNIRETNWDERNSIRAGKSANADVFWAFIEAKELISILVGQDDESWDFAVCIPIERIEPLIEKHLKDNNLRHSNNKETK